MSADWELLFSQPGAMAWQPGTADPRQALRLLDAPIGRYLVGAARWISGQAALPADWNWSASWEQNRQAGSLPDPALLQAGRMGQAVWFPFSLLLLYLTGVKLGGRFFGWSAALMMAANALFLLHARRAQAEGALVFFICLTLACLVYCRKSPWLIAIPAALAFCAKQSAFPLIAVGLAAIWVYRARPVSVRRLFTSVLLYLGLTVGIVFLLNPFLWAHPVEAAQAAIRARQEFLTEQTQEFRQLAPDQILDNPAKAGLSFLVNLYLTPPSFAEAGNYVEQTRQSAEAYLANPANQLFRSLWGGGILLAISLIGWASATIAVIKSGHPHRLEIGLVGLSGLLLLFALVLTVTLPFQRYVMPLVPFATLSTAYGLNAIQVRIRQLRMNQEVYR